MVRRKNMDIVVGVTETIVFIVENNTIIIVQMMVSYEKSFWFSRFRPQEHTNLGECLEDDVGGRKWK